VRKSGCYHDNGTPRPKPGSGDRGFRDETLWIHDEFCACAGTDFRDLESRGWIKIGGTQVVWEYGRAPKAGRERAYDYLTRNGLRIDTWMLD
jgi:hypothetical protein